MKKNKKSGVAFLLAFYLVSQFFYIFLFQTPGTVRANTLLNSYDTLDNPRLSFASTLNGSLIPGSTTISINTSSVPDADLTNLFPFDTVAIGTNGFCSGSICTVSSRSASLTTFELTKGITNGVSSGDPVIATQSSKHTIKFNVTSSLNTGYKVRVLIPAGASNMNDGKPDGLGNAGFDLNSVGTGDFTCADSVNNTTGWSSTSVSTTTPGFLEFVCTTTNTNVVSGTTITVTIGTGSKKIINPAPKLGHTRGVADTYNLRIFTLNASSSPIDSDIISVAPVDGVLVSATINAVLNLTISGENSGTTRCGVTTGVTTTATTVPFGEISTPAAWNNASQKITASTNALNGYSISVAQDSLFYSDTNGDGALGSPDKYIPDIPCDTGKTCTTSSPGQWQSSSPVTNGWGYSLDNNGGSAGNGLTNPPATARLPFIYNTTSVGNCTAGTTYCARSFGLSSTTYNEIANSTGPVAAQDFYMCYRLSIPPTQEAGYYQTRVLYQALAKF
ncbi:hypothetical protein HGA88_00280 [Candidatus Roizmanbacteria bacterium]|nr:hypothetical protein [Candidatus Roizmanbacteria bacterium]